MQMSALALVVHQAVRQIDVNEPGAVLPLANVSRSMRRVCVGSAAWWTRRGRGAFSEECSHLSKIANHGVLCGLENCKNSVSYFGRASESLSGFSSGNAGIQGAAQPP